MASRTSLGRPRQQAAGARRTGYVFAVGVNAVLLYLVNVRPGWAAVPFLTADTSLVLGAVNASIAVNLAANVVYLLRDPAWLKALGDTVTLSVGLAALVRIWQVFPFDLGTEPVDWVLLTRILLLVGMAGSGIAILVALVRFGRSVAAGTTVPRS